MELSVRRFFIGQLVFAKIKGYPPWPGLIIEIDKCRAKAVYFNWRNQYNWIGFEKITPAASAAAIVAQHYSTNIQFRRAVDELNLMANSILQQRAAERQHQHIQTVFLILKEKILKEN